MAIVLSQVVNPLLTTRVVNKLKQMKVHSVVDLISCDLSQLQSNCRQKGLNFEKLLEVRNELSARFGAKRVNALNLLTDSVVNTRVHEFSTHIQKYMSFDSLLRHCLTFVDTFRVDDVLKSGFRRGRLTQIEGNSGSAKTLFCYNLMTSVAKEYDEKVLYLDTELSFSDQKVVQIVSNRYPETSETEMNDILSKIYVIQVLDIASLLNVIESIDYDLRTNETSVYKDIGLVVLDSVSILLTLEFKKNGFNSLMDERCGRRQRAKTRNSQSFAAITQMAQSLRALASIHSMAVVVTNSQLIALKNTWNNFCDLCLQFECTEVDDNQSVVTIKTIQTYDTSADISKEICLEMADLGVGDDSSDSESNEEKSSPMKSWPESESQSDCETKNE